MQRLVIDNGTSSCRHAVIHKMYSIGNHYPNLKEKLDIARKNAFIGLGCIITTSWVENLEKNLPIPSDQTDLQDFLNIHGHILNSKFKIQKPIIQKGSEMQKNLDSIQKYLNSLGYCYLQVSFFDIKKNTCIRTLMRTARDM